MCGILAVWNRRGAPIDTNVTLGALEKMWLRGPDDVGLTVLNTRDGAVQHAASGWNGQRAVRLPLEGDAGPWDIALGHTRLSLVDLTERGHQPMTTGDGALWITFNGEIYNHKAIRAALVSLGHRFSSRSDTEVVLRAYQEWGADCLQRFNGMWALAIYDCRAHQLFVARDRLGVKPLVYSIDRDRFVCASDVRSLRALARERSDLDCEAVHHYLSMMCVPAPWTIWSDVRKLRPGHYLRVSPDRVEECCFWRPHPCHVQASEPASATEELRDLLDDAVGLRLVADAPVGVFLSGGLDSSAIVASAACHQVPVSFTAAFGSMQHFDETDVARCVADSVGSDLRLVDVAGLASDELGSTLLDFVSHMDEPLADPAALGVYLLARVARSDVKAVLTGDGGDEVLAGYPRHWDILWRTAACRPKKLGWLRSQGAADGFPPVRWNTERRVDRVLRRRRWHSLDDGALQDRLYMRQIMCATEEEKRDLYNGDWRHAVREFDTAAWLVGLFPAEAHDHLARWQSFDIVTTLPNLMLAKVDKATMAASLEARGPLLDYRLVEWGLRLPAATKIGVDSGKLPLRRLCSERLPPGIADRSKHGFSMPVASWLSGPLRVLVTDRLLSRTSDLPSVVDSVSLQRAMIASNRVGGRSLASLLFAILVLQLWIDEHVGS